MEYLYGNLNKLIEAQKYKFTSSDNTVVASITDKNQVNLSVNTKKLITLKQVKKDLDPKDDPIKYYALYAYNPISNQFDIKLGDEIKIDLSTSDDAASKVETAYVKVGEEQKYDESGNPIYDENGKPVMVPILKEVVTDVSQTGQLVISQIPASAIVDKTTEVDESGNTVEVQIESNLDGNAGGDVY